MAKRVIAAMSGGVDSSVAAALLKEQGYDVIGVTMQLWPPDLPQNHESGCCSLSAVEDARRVANKLDIPYYVLSMHEDFHAAVIEQFADEYLLGRTPNPCIVCNERIKFGALLERAFQLESDYVATGHYAIIEKDPETGRHIVRRPQDDRKDQTYTFHGLKQEQLRRILTPLGAYTKPEVRRMAEGMGLVTADKPDSQEICFIPNNDYKSFLQAYRPESKQPGSIVDTAGRVLGRHDGIVGFTVGQRRGIGIAASEPLYVVAIRAEANEVVVGTRDEVFSTSLIAARTNWIAVETLQQSMEVDCQIRYHARPFRGIIAPLDGDKVLVRFAEPQRAVAPGQSVVWYDGDVMVGGGIIETGQRTQETLVGNAAR